MEKTQFSQCGQGFEILESNILSIRLNIEKNFEHKFIYVEIRLHILQSKTLGIGIFCI